MAISISIITINYNNINGLIKTFNSVKNQYFKHIEYIIVDGDSKDGSVDFLNENAKEFSHLIIEKDKGIYDAMNKGLDKCTGDFCLFLNSGDYFFSEKTLKNIVEKIDDKNKVYFSTAKIMSKQAEWLVPPENKNINQWLKKHTPNHQTVLFPKSFYGKNRYDLFYSIVGDVDYIQRAKQELKFIFINEITVIFELGGVSNNTSNFKRIKKQIKESLVVHLKFYPNKLFYIFYVPLKFWAKYIVSKLTGSNYDKALKFINKYK